MAAHAAQGTWSGDVKLRVVCGNCLSVRRERIAVKFRRPYKDAPPFEAITMPQCCGADMLIAGEPKTDTTGVTGKIGTVVDPVDNLRKRDG